MTDKLRAAAKAVLESTKSFSVYCENFSHRPQDLHDDGECPSWRRYNDALAELEDAFAKPAIKESLTPQRPWVGLTDEDKTEIKKLVTYDQFETAGEYANRVQAATESKLKEKNT